MSEHHIKRLRAEAEEAARRLAVAAHTPMDADELSAIRDEGGAKHLQRCKDVQKTQAAACDAVNAAVHEQDSVVRRLVVDTEYWKDRALTSEAELGRSPALGEEDPR